MQRISYLDGLRGIACLQVVLAHYAYMYWPQSVPYLGFFSNGNAPVFLFFLMSGFVLTRSFSRNEEPAMTKAARRLVRLEIPALAAVVVSILLSFPAYSMLHAISPPPTLWLQQIVNAMPAAGNFSDLNGASLLLGYRQTCPISIPWLSNITAAPDGPLWTLSIELWGSLLILVLTRLRHTSMTVQTAGLAALAFITGIHPLSLFIAGYLCARTTIKARSGLGASLLAIGFMLNICRPVPLVYDALVVVPVGILKLYPWFNWQHEIGAVLIFLGVLMTPVMQVFLDQPLFRRLGRLSFSIYLLHWPVMLAAGGAVFLLAQPLGGQIPPFLTCLVGIPLTFGFAGWFEQYIDAPAVRLSRSSWVWPKGSPSVIPISSPSAKPPQDQ